MASLDSSPSSGAFAGDTTAAAASRDLHLALEVIREHLGSAPVQSDRASAPGCQIIIADCHELSRHGLRALLEAHCHEVVGEATTGQEVAALVERHPGGIVLLDLELPDSGGLSLLQTLERDGHDARCLVLSSSRDVDGLSRAVSAGARGYLTRDCEPVELFAAIELIRLGGFAFGSAAGENLRAGMASVDREGTHRERRRLGITDREYEILCALPTSRGLAQIADDLFVSKKTVQNNVSSLYGKLAVSSRQEAVAEAIRLRLILGFADH